MIIEKPNLFTFTLIFAQGVDYLLCHISGKPSNKYLSPVIVSRKLDDLKNAVKQVSKR